MRDQFKIVVFLLAVGVILAAFTARPETQFFVDERSVDAYSNVFFTYTTIRYPSYAEVIDPPENDFQLSVNVDTNVIDFSTVLGEGGSVRRQINLTSRDEEPSKITVKAFGDISPLLRFDKEDFVLRGRDVIHVTLDTTGQESGNYTGEIDVIIQRSNHGFLKYLIGY